MKFLKITVGLFWGALFLSACFYQAPRAVNRSFYYWKTDFSLRRNETAAFKRLGVNRIYLRLFDVAWHGAAVPVAPVRFHTLPPPFLAIIPTVFITNETLNNLPVAQVPDLAAKISRKIERLTVAGHLGTVGGAVSEVQIDCDWTLQTRAKYFHLLQGLKSDWAGRKVRLSATIRLHQVKYRRLTGVPPVDRGMLMFYNLAPVNDFRTKNSILDAALGRQYLADLKTYPLPLDVALPLFSWGVIFQDDRFIGLANGFRRAELQQNPDFEVFKQNTNYFRVKHNTYLHHTQLYADDLIRVEESEARTLRECATYLAGRLPGNARVGKATPVTVALFHFDRENMRRISDAEMAALFNCFR